MLPQAGVLRYVDHVEGRGEATFAQAESMGLEGLIAKRRDSPYRSGSSNDWLKIRTERRGDFVVLGFSAPQGSRSSFGALHLGAYQGKNLRYVGKVGSGFSEAQLTDARAKFEDQLRETPAFNDAVPQGDNHRWLEPTEVCEVRYREFTDDGLLRMATFLGWRPDKSPHECPYPDPSTAPPPRSSPHALPPAQIKEERTPKLSNLDKIFWPQEKLSKGDLIHFYESVAPWLLPYLGDRLVVLTRYPDGIEGKSFFQKDAPSWVPSWVRTRAYLEPACQTRNRVLRLRRRGNPSFFGELGHHSAAYLEQSSGRSGAPRLVHPGSRSQGRPL